VPFFPTPGVRVDYSCKFTVNAADYKIILAFFSCLGLISRMRASEK
jgi:hypothetical protein